MGQSSIKSGSRRVWLALGGLAGILALIIGLTQILQTERDTRGDSAVDATIIFFQQEQLQVLKDLATLQASTAIPGPEATAVAEQIELLEGTTEALNLVLDIAPDIKVLSTEMPELDTVVFYQAVAEHKITKINDGWHIRIEEFPPYDGEVPVFSLSDLPVVELPITLMNVGTKPTTVNGFRLTLYGDPALTSGPGIIIDDAGIPLESQSVFLDVGQIQEITTQFSWLNLEDLPKPEHPGMSWAHPILFRGLLQLDILDIEGNESSTLIESGRAEVDSGRQYMFWWATLLEEEGIVKGTTAEIHSVEIRNNPYIIDAYLKAESVSK